MLSLGALLFFSQQKLTSRRIDSHVFTLLPPPPSIPSTLSSLPPAFLSHLSLAGSSPLASAKILRIFLSISLLGPVAEDMKAGVVFSNALEAPRGQGTYRITIATPSSISKLSRLFFHFVFSLFSSFFPHFLQSSAHSYVRALGFSAASTRSTAASAGRENTQHQARTQQHSPTHPPAPLQLLV